MITSLLGPLGSTWVRVMFSRTFKWQFHRLYMRGCCGILLTDYQHVSRGFSVIRLIQHRLRCYPISSFKLMQYHMFLSYIYIYIQPLVTQNVIPVLMGRFTISQEPKQTLKLFFLAIITSPVRTDH